MCGCERAKIVSGKPPDRKSLDFSVVDSLPKDCHKACSDLNREKILVDRAFFSKWSPAQQDYALAHEVAHLSGADCESCADYGAGAIMRKWGWSRTASLDAARTVVTNRWLSSVEVGNGWNDSRTSNRSLDLKTQAAKMNYVPRYAVVQAGKLADPIVKLTPIAPKAPAQPEPDLNISKGAPTSDQNGFGFGGQLFLGVIAGVIVWAIVGTK